MNVRMGIQHSDCSDEQLGYVSAEIAFDRLIAANWTDNFRFVAECFLQRKPQCPPCMYLYRQSDEHLTCYPASKVRFLLNACIELGKTCFGRTKMKELAVAPVDAPTTRDIINVFASAPAKEIVSFISQYPLLNNGIPGSTINNQAVAGKCQVYIRGR